MVATARRAQPERPDQDDVEIQFDARTRTLRGDVRDLVLREFKTMQKAWPQMTESEQSRLIQRASDIAGTVVRRCVDLVAEDGLPSLPVTVGKLTLEGGAIKGTYECFADDENLLSIRRLQSKRAMFVLADPDEYFGQRGKAEPDNVGDLGIPRQKEGTQTIDDDPFGVGDGFDPDTGEVSTATKGQPRADEAELSRVGRGRPEKGAEAKV